MKKLIVTGTLLAFLGAVGLPASAQTTEGTKQTQSKQTQSKQTHAKKTTKKHHKKTNQTT